MKIIIMPRVDILPFLEPPLPPYLNHVCNDTQDSIKTELRRTLKQTRVSIPPVLYTPLPSDLIFERIEDPHVPSGDIPPRLSPPPLCPDSAEYENGGGVSGNINKGNSHNVAQRDGNEKKGNTGCFV